MFRRLAYLVSFALLLAAVPAVTHAQVENLMHTDPSFEDEIIIVSPGWASWTTWGGGGSVEIDTTDFIDGAKSLRVNQTSGQFNVIAAAIPMTPGDRHTCSFWAKADAPRPISVRFQSMNNSGFVAGNFDLTTEWAEYTFTEEAPNPNNDIKLQFITNDALGISYWLDFVFCYAGEYVAGIEPSGLSRVKAAGPDPADGAVDVPREAVLNWIPGEYSNTHDVYFGTSFDDVNNAAPTVDLTGVYRGRLSDSSYAVPERLNLGETYYWRIDEVNAPPDSTVSKGDVWSFTIEPVGYPLDGANITATASSSMAGSAPEKTIDGSGLDDSDLHSTRPEDMWLSDMLGPQPTWIEYQFDKVYKLHEMSVWNQNQIIEPSIGYGFKDVSIEYSADGIAYTTLGTTHEFARGPGAAGYAANTHVDFGGAAAKYVKLTVNSGWESILTQYGLSEVRFSYIPVGAREPSPDSGATDADVNAVLSFRAGREAATHDVYLSTDEQAVIDGTAPMVTVTEPSYASSLDLATTYYWRVDEVNDTKSPTTWQGDIWNFSTQEYLVVDDFESYNDIPAGEEGSNLVYVAWVDGFDNPSANGSTMGYVTAESLETGNVHDGSKSVPLAYNNTSAGISEVVRTFTPAQNWTAHGVKTLSLWFAGDSANVAGQLYVKVNGVQVNYDGDAGNLTLAGWQTWNNDLTAINTNLSNVTSLTIGIQGPGASGTLLLDDIRLYSYDRQFVTPVDPGTAGLQAHYEFEGNTNDSSDNARHGTAAGNPLFGEGRIGQAIDLDGLGDYVNIDGYKGVLGSSAITVTAWIKTSSTSTGAIVGWGPNVSGERFGFRVDLGRLRAEHAGGNIQGDTLVNDGGWHHVAVTVRENVTISYPDVILYLDGADDTRPTTDADPVFNITAAEDVSIGRRPSVDDRYFIGQIDEVRIYDRALTQEEVNWLTGRIEPFDKPF